MDGSRSIHGLDSGDSLFNWIGRFSRPTDMISMVIELREQQRDKSEQFTVVIMRLFRNVDSVFSV